MGRLRFDLDEQRHWSLFYHGGRDVVPLIASATLGAWIAGGFITLADLEYSTLGTRRPPGGESLIVRGRAGGVVLEAEFLSSTEAAAPQASVSVRIYPDRNLPTVGGIRFFQAPEAAVLPGEGDLTALINGADSETEARLVTISAAGAPDEPMVESHGTLGLLRGRRGLAFAFDAEDPGSGHVQIASDGLEAASEWVPTRPLRSDGDAASLHLCYDPDGDCVSALHSLFLPPSALDRERLATQRAPAGWCSWYALGEQVSEADVLAQLDFCAGRFDRRFFRFVQLDQGFERSAGDWETNPKFPHGHRWLTDQIRARGFEAGLWLAPFAAAERSSIPDAHPDWLVKGADGTSPVVVDTRGDWGRVFALDGAHPAVQEWLRVLARRCVEDWGYTYLKLDLAQMASLPEDGTHYGGLTHGEACRLGLGALRDGAGSDTFLLGVGAPLQHSAGLVSGMRVGPNVDASWEALHAPARETELRSFYHRGVWLNDPDCLVARPPLSVAEAQLWATMVATNGGLTFFSDDLTKLAPERLALLDRVIPPANCAARPIGIAAQQSSVGAPAAAWIVEGAPGWWTVLLANWTDETRELRVPVRSLGITGKRFAAYDVWNGVALPDVTDTVHAKLEPHSGVTIALRAASARPQIVGTTRHVVQGAVDVVEESWNPTTRTLRARATNLDARPYAITIAVPASLRLGACKADRPCTVQGQGGGHATMTWDAPPTSGPGGDVAWELAFRPAPLKKR